MSRFVCLFAVGLTGFAWPAAADRLDEAALQTPRALESAVLSATRAGSRIVAVGLRGHVLYSDDEGVSWGQAEVPVRVSLTAAFFQDGRKGFAVGHDTVVLTTDDGGGSWSRVLDGREANEIRERDMLAVIAAHQAAVDALPEGSNERSDAEFALDDKRFFLEEVERDKGIGPHKALFDIVAPNGAPMVAVGASGLVLASRDGGETWEDWSARLDNSGLFHLYAVIALPQDGFLIAGEGGILFRSHDGGESWKALDSPTENSMFDLERDSSSGAIYLLGMAGEFYESRDAGDSWSRLETGTQSILQSAHVGVDGRVLVAGLEGVALSKREGDDAFASLKGPGFPSNTRLLSRKAGGGTIIFGGGGVRTLDGANAAVALEYEQ